MNFTELFNFISNLDWKNLGITIIGSSIVSTFISSKLNENTQIRVMKEEKLQSKRLKILDEIIRKMEVVNKLANEIVLPFEDIKAERNNEKDSNLIRALNDFGNYFNENRHYLSKNISDKIYNLNNKYFDVYLGSFDKKINSKSDKDTIDMLVKNNMDYFISLSNEKELLVDEFRKIIGVK